MRILVLQHDEDAGLGSLEAPLRLAGAEIEAWLAHRDPAPPRAVTEYDGVVILGGVVHPDQDDDHPWLTTERAVIETALGTGTPTLGLCLGGQLLAQTAGGSAGPAAVAEIGWYTVAATPALAEDELFSVLPETFPTFQWHAYCFEPPPGATLLARNASYNQAFRIGSSAWGTQFHIEADGDTIREWLGVGADDIRAHDLDPATIARDTGEHDAAHIALANRLGNRFAEIVRAYAVARKA